MTLTQFRATLEAHGCKPRGNGQISARCPAHDDGTASLSVSEAENKILIHDQAGCSPEAVVKALNLKMADLFNDKPHRNDEHKRNANQQALNWPRCVSDFTDRAMRELAEGRGFSIEFVRWLHGKGDVGLHGGSIAFANRDQSGTVLSCHKLYDRQNKKWIFEPSGQQVSPWIFGDIATAGFILAFESQWDALAAMDKLEWHAGHGLADAAVVVTRGAGNGKLIAGRCSPDASIFAFVQNDQPAETWLAAIVAHAGCKVLRVRMRTIGRGRAQADLKSRQLSNMRSESSRPKRCRVNRARRSRFRMLCRPSWTLPNFSQRRVSCRKNWCPGFSIKGAN
jgi:hypothetical protein